MDSRETRVVGHRKNARINRRDLKPFDIEPFPPVQEGSQPVAEALPQRRPQIACANCPNNRNCWSIASQLRDVVSPDNRVVRDENEDRV